MQRRCGRRASQPGAFTLGLQHIHQPGDLLFDASQSDGSCANRQEDKASQYRRPTLFALLCCQHRVPDGRRTAGDWAEVDSDWSYTVLARIGAPGSNPADGMSATFRHSCLRQGKHQDYVAFYGSRGTIHVDKAYCQGALHLLQEGDASFREVPVTAEILTWLPPVERRANWAAGWEVPQRAWNALARDFVADIEGRDHQPYLSIEDGWRHQEAIDAVRAVAGWAKLSAEL
jgi:predicted dehydrogenase